MGEHLSALPKPRHADIQSRANPDQQRWMPAAARHSGAMSDPASRAVLLAQMQHKLNSAPKVAQLHALAEGLMGRNGVVQRVENIDKKENTKSGAFSIKMDKALSYGHFDEPAPTMDTAIEFTLRSDYSNNVDPLVLDQIVRAVDSESGTLSSWKGSNESRREKMKTEDDDLNKVEKGWFVDHLAMNYKPRTKKNEAQLPTDYISSSLKQEAKDNLKTGKNQIGKKVGEENVPAKMFDAPASPQPYDFKAEVIAKGTENGKTEEYGTLVWGFTTGVKDVGSEKDKGNKSIEVKSAYANVTEAPSANYRAALAKFHDVYHNAESSTSPENIEGLVKKIESLQNTSEEKDLVDRAKLKVELAGVFEKINLEEDSSDSSAHDYAKQLAQFPIGGVALTTQEAEAYEKNVGKLPDYVRVKEEKKQLPSVMKKFSFDDESDNLKLEDIDDEDIDWEDDKKPGEKKKDVKYEDDEFGEYVSVKVENEKDKKDKKDEKNTSAWDDFEVDWSKVPKSVQENDTNKTNNQTNDEF